MPEQQYFASQPQAQSDARPFTLTWQGREYRFLTDAGVFSKGELDFGTKVLLGALPDPGDGQLLDLGCGWGAVGVLMGALYPAAHITMTDINQRAVALARENARANGVSATVVAGDGLEQAPGPWDVIALNPPIRAGKQVVYRLFAQCAAALTPGGALYVVIRRQQGADSAKQYLRTLFDQVDTVARKGGFHVFRCGGASAGKENCNE